MNAKPYDNSSFDIEDLTIESANDVISIHGSLDIRKDQIGLKNAKELNFYFSALVKKLEDINTKVLLPQKCTIESPIIKINPLS